MTEKGEKLITLLAGERCKRWISPIQWIWHEIVLKRRNLDSETTTKVTSNDMASQLVRLSEPPATKQKKKIE